MYALKDPVGDSIGRRESEKEESRTVPHLCSCTHSGPGLWTHSGRILARLFWHGYSGPGLPQTVKISSLLHDARAGCNRSASCSAGRAGFRRVPRDGPDTAATRPFQRTRVPSLGTLEANLPA